MGSCSSCVRTKTGAGPAARRSTSRASRPATNRESARTCCVPSSYAPRGRCCGCGRVSGDSALWRVSVPGASDASCREGRTGARGSVPVCDEASSLLDMRHVVGVMVDRPPNRREIICWGTPWNATAMSVRSSRGSVDTSGTSLHVLADRWHTCFDVDRSNAVPELTCASDASMKVKWSLAGARGAGRGCGRGSA